MNPELLNLGIQTLLYIWIFVVPGFISLKIKETLIGSPNKSEFSELIESVLHSFVILAIAVVISSILGITIIEVNDEGTISSISLALVAILISISGVWGLSLVILIRKAKKHIIKFFRDIGLTDFTGSHIITEDMFPSDKTIGVRFYVGDKVYTGKVCCVPNYRDSFILLKKCEVMSGDGNIDKIAGSIALNIDKMSILEIYDLD